MTPFERPTVAGMAEGMEEVLVGVIIGEGTTAVGVAMGNWTRVDKLGVGAKDRVVREVDCWIQQQNMFSDLRRRITTNFSKAKPTGFVARTST